MSMVSLTLCGIWSQNTHPSIYFYIYTDSNFASRAPFCLLPFAFRIKQMEEKQNSMIKSSGFSSLIQYVILGVLFLVLLHLYGAQAIQESTIPLEYFLSNSFSRLIRLILYLCSNYVFLVLLCNVIIWCLLVTSGLLSTSSEANCLSKEYVIEREDQRLQIDAEPLSVEKKYAVHKHEHQDEVDYIDNESIWKGGKKSKFAENRKAYEIYLTENFEEESIWDQTAAVIPYQSPLAAGNGEEFERQCDEFIAKFRRQMSMQNGHS